MSKVNKKWYIENGRYFNGNGTEVIGKVCNKCNNYKLLGEFYVNSNCKFGFGGICKNCKSLYRKEYGDINRDSLKAKSKKYCDENKDIIRNKREAYLNKNKKRIKEVTQKYYNKNREIIVERSKTYYSISKDIVLLNRKEYYNINRNTIAKLRREYYKTPQGRENSKRARQKRRALKLSNGGSYTSVQWENCLLFFDNKCAYSGSPVVSLNTHIEHIKPLSKGGTGYIWNLCPSLSTINLSKSNSSMEEWYKKQEYFSEERLSKIYEWQEHAYEKYHKEYFSIGLVEK